MRKPLLAWVCSLLLSTFLFEGARAQLTSVNEGFDTVGSAGPPATGIFAAGWLTMNNSSPIGDHNWGQGIPPGMTDALGANAQSGAPNSFIQTDFNAGLAGSSAIVSDWLITPVLLLENGATMSFYTQASPTNTQFPNELQVFESQSGSSTVNAGSTAASPGGDFTIQLLDINPGATIPSGTTGGYPTTWTQFTFTISGLSAPTDGRFGFRFYLPNNNTDGTLIGIDTFSFADPTVVIRTVSGNWTDTTGWTPTSVPNGNTVTAQLVNPGSGTNIVNLGGGTFTVDQLQFSETNTGTWNVTNGTIIFDGTNPTFLNQGDSSGLVGSLPNLQLNATTTFEIDNASAATSVTGAIIGTGGLTKTGNGTLMLTGTNTYSGGTSLNGGTLAVNSDNNLGTGALSFNGGTLEALAAGGGITSSKAVALNAGGGTFLADSGTNSTLSGVIGGSGSFTKAGSGTLTLSGTNTYSIGTSLNGGTLAVNSDNNLGTGALSFNGGTLEALAVGGGITSSKAVTLNAGGGTFSADAGTSSTLSGVISGSGRLVQLGSGTLILTGAETFTGGTIVNAGTLQLGDGIHTASLAGGNGSTGFPGGAGTDAVTVNNSAKFNVMTNASVSGGAGGVGVGLSNPGNGGEAVNFSAGGSLTNSGTISGGAGGTAGRFGGVNGTDGFGVLFSGVAGTLTNLSGGVINGGVMMGNFANVFTLDTGSVINGILNLGTSTAAALTLDGSGIQLYSTAVTGATTLNGALTKNGAGTWTLDESFTYTGGTTINAGTLNVRADINLGAASSGLTFNGGILQWGASFNLSATRTITLEAGGGTFDTDGFNTTIARGITGSGGLTKAGMGTLTLTGSNTYSGGTSFNAGILAVNNDGNLGTGILSFNGGILEALAGGGGIVTSKAVTLHALGGTFLADTGTTSALSGVISGLGAFTKNGGGTLALIGNNTYTGGTTINAGTLQIGNGGTSGSIGGNVNDNATFAFNRSDPVTFGGVINGIGALVQMGSGTLTLTGDNSYNGGTTINTGATLQLGNGSTTGSIVGNVTDNGTLIFNRSDNVTFNAIISGPGNLAQNGSGTTILGGANTYSGGTIINNGTLLVNNSQALGLGNVVVNGGVLGADPQPINVKGNYTQNAGGTLQLQVAGNNPGQYDTLNVGGNAALGGTLQLISLGFQPNAGNQLTLVSSGGIVSGQFAHFVNPFSVRPGLNTIDLIYGKQSVVLEFLNQTTPVSPVIPTVPTVPTSPSVVPLTVIATINFASFALTPNQLTAAKLLDPVQMDPRAANLISFLDKQPFANLPGDFEKISPEGLTAFYEISFSNANIQRLTLESRLDDIRNGSNGFSSNMKVNGATVNQEDKAAVDGKTSKSVVEPVLQPGPENRWGVWVTGFGDFVNVDGDGNAKGYDFTTGGVSVGVDYRITDHLAIGVMGEYAHTWTSQKPSGNIDVDSGRGGLYASWFSHGIYLDGAIYGGHNTYESSRSSLGGLATGGTEGAEWSTFISGGYDFHLGHLSVGPIGALQYTYVNINGFSENSSLAPLAIHSGSAESLRSDFGFRAFYQWQIGKIVVEPSLKAAWEHEYKYSALPITAGFAGIPGPSATFFGPNEGHDSAVLSAGVSAQWTPAILTYVNYDGQLGRGNYDSNAVTGGIRISF